MARQLAPHTWSAGTYEPAPSEQEFVGGQQVTTSVGLRGACCAQCCQGRPDLHAAAANNASLHCAVLRSAASPASILCLEMAQSERRCKMEPTRFLTRFSKAKYSAAVLRQSMSIYCMHYTTAASPRDDVHAPELHSFIFSTCKQPKHQSCKLHSLRIRPSAHNFGPVRMSAEEDDQGGLCLCQQDSYLRKLVTTVVR